MKTIILFVATAIALNLLITINITRFKHPELTETQLFLHIPKSFIWKLN